MSEHYIVSLHIDRVPNQPNNPEAIGDPIVVADHIATIEGAQLFIRGLQRMATKIQPFIYKKDLPNAQNPV